MLTRLLVSLSSASPFLRRVLWRWWYGRLATQISAGSWTFMNYGFIPPENSSPPLLALHPEDEPDRHCIQLYQRVVTPGVLTGASVLEVGSGRGGGARYLARYLHPESITGIDYSPQAIAFCRHHHQGVANLQFSVGDAENLPFEDSTFDVVVNVESSHCYGDIRKFFREVTRVLRPGGRFVFADLRGATEMGQLMALLKEQSEWQEIEREDITASVAAALESDDLRKRARISELVPPRWQPLFAEFAGVVGGQVWRGLRTRELLYFRFDFLCTNPAPPAPR